MVEHLNPPLKHPSSRLLYNSNGHDVDLLQPSPLHKPYPPTGSNKAQIFNGDAHRTRFQSFVNRSIPSTLPRLLFVPRCKFFVLGSFALVLLLVFFAFPVERVYPALMYPFPVRPNQALFSPIVHNFNGRQLNQTLLALAKVDLNERAEHAEINNILEGTWGRATAQSRYSLMHDRLRHEDLNIESFHYRRRQFRPRDPRLPIQLSSPRYTPFWPQFRSSLHAWVQNKRHDPHIMTQLLGLVKDPIDKHYMKKSSHTVAPGKPYKTCAVVGNSGILLNQSYGSEIDSHEMVMRLNNAPIVGLEQHVGSKTTLSFVNSNILHSCARRTGCRCHPYGSDVPLIMYICQVVHFMDVAMCNSSQPAPIIVTDARFDTLCAYIVKYYSLKRFVETTGRPLEDWSGTHEGPLFHYSSGMQAVLLSVGICEKVSIFGFGKSETARHHYHTSQKEELQLHDYAAEYDFYIDLMKQDAQLIPFLNEAGFSLPSIHVYW